MKLFTETTFLFQRQSVFPGKIFVGLASHHLGGNNG